MSQHMKSVVLFNNHPAGARLLAGLVLVAGRGHR